MKSVRFLIGFLIFVLGVLLMPPAHAKVPIVSLGQLVRASDVILIGHVDRGRVVQGVKIAQVTVQSALKGRIRSPVVYFVAECTGECDVSAATTGEQALLFLSPVPGNRVTRETLRQPSVSVGLHPLYFLADGGRGRMPLCFVRDKSYVSEIGVRMPGLPTIPSLDPEPEYAGFARSFPLSKVQGLILAQLSKGQG